MKKSVMGLVFVGLSLGVGACATSVEHEEPTSNDTEAARQFCGGIAGIACPDGYTCVDAPGDGCDPMNGGADCGGVCKKAPGGTTKCNYGDPSRSYVSKDPNQCAAILFMCVEGTQAFFDECGCGCETATTKCDYSDPNITWISQSATECSTIKFYCATGTGFSNECGCGCDNTPTTGTPCGTATCGAGEYCCNESCSICAPEGGVCTQQFCG